MSDAMSEMLLLGAGASIEAGVPGAYDMTKEIVARLRANHRWKREAHLLSFVAGGLLLEAGKENRDPFTSGVNVEDLFNAVQLLAERNSLEAAPFVGAWHPMVEEFDKISPSYLDTSRILQAIYRPIAEQIRRAFGRHDASFDARRIDEAVKSALNGSGWYISSVGEAVERYVKATTEAWARDLGTAWISSNSELNREMAELFEQQATKPAEGRIFHHATELMTAELKNLVWIDDANRVRYLAPILNLLQTERRLTMATLNYDNSIEILASSCGVACETGIEAWSNGGETDFSSDGISLLKLHGSIDWTWEKGKVSSDRPMPHRVVNRIDPVKLQESKTPPCVIFGQRNKLTAEGPFLDLLRAFQRELARANILTIVGYSFRDLHINVYISHWLNGDTQRVLRVVNGPSFPEEARDIEYGRHLLRLTKPASDRIQIMADYAGDGLKKLYGEYSRSNPSVSQTT